MGHYDLHWDNFTHDGNILIARFPQTTDGVVWRLRVDEGLMVSAVSEEVSTVEGVAQRH